jgi:hypothetical protein
MMNHVSFCHRHKRVVCCSKRPDMLRAPIQWVLLAVSQGRMLVGVSARTIVWESRSVPLLLCLSLSCIGTAVFSPWSSFALGVSGIWRCMYRASYCNVYINQRDAQILVNGLYFFVKWLYVFRNIISPSSGATFNKLYSEIGTCRYLWLLYGYSHTTPRRMVPAYTNCTVQFIKCFSWWWTNYSPKRVEPLNEKLKTIHKNLCISLVYVHISEIYLRKVYKWRYVAHMSVP